MNVTTHDGREAINRVDLVLKFTKTRIDDFITCSPGVCKDCDFLRELLGSLDRITPHTLDVLRSLADRLDTFNLGDDSRLY